jgi:hypothetical protein
MRSIVTIETIHYAASEEALRILRARGLHLVRAKENIMQRKLNSADYRSSSSPRAGTFRWR